jgi:hypothetical protein
MGDRMMRKAQKEPPKPRKKLWERKVRHQSRVEKAQGIAQDEGRQAGRWVGR